ncbi:hypothetical protein [Aquamicrobium sp.]|uniref:hypothetical protein n=1 Tax=Aquamicrobium sp. TaxID=1872579 RepID=UPI00258A1283|nr:hypothetical protein [Aquamicrobium sp.]MCK9549458.1 hypothetical protein [Aquamicrobium sp.]
MLFFWLSIPAILSVLGTSFPNKMIKLFKVKSTTLYLTLAILCALYPLYSPQLLISHTELLWAWVLIWLISTGYLTLSFVLAYEYMEIFETIVEINYKAKNTTKVEEYINENKKSFGIIDPYILRDALLYNLERKSKKNV